MSQPRQQKHSEDRLEEESSKTCRGLGSSWLKTLKESKIEDRSTLVNNSYILGDAIQRVLSVLESVRVLKMLINYWSLIFALLLLLVIPRGPENQVQMKVVGSSGRQLFELDFGRCSGPVKQMLGGGLLL